MSASANAAINEAIGESIVSLPITASTHLYKKQLASIVVGYAKALVSGEKFAGVVLEEADNSSGAAGAISVNVQRKITMEVALPLVNRYMIGAYVYAIDDNTFTLQPMRTPVGRVVQIGGCASGYALVAFDADLCRKTMGAVNGSFLDFFDIPMCGSAVTALGGWRHTLVDGGGDAAQAIGGLDGGAGPYHNGMVIVTNDAENDGSTLLKNGENYYLDAVTKPLFFGTRIKIDDATQSDFFIGIAIEDTSLLAAVTDDISIRKVDASTDVNLVVEKDNIETASAAAIAVAANNTYLNLGFIYDGTSVYPMVNGVAGTALAVTNLPNDEALKLAIEILTGAAAVRTFTIDFIDCYQLRNS